MHKSLATVLLLLDFSKAFDSVNHDLLLRKLSERFEFSDMALKLVDTYLNGRNQKVVINGFSSTFLDIMIGIQQGSILSPLFFSAFINYLTSVIKFSSG